MSEINKGARLDKGPNGGGGQCLTINSKSSGLKSIIGLLSALEEQDCIAVRDLRRA